MHHVVSRDIWGLQGYPLGTGSVEQLLEQIFNLSLHISALLNASSTKYDWAQVTKYIWSQVRQATSMSEQIAYPLLAPPVTMHRLPSSNRMNSLTLPFSMSSTTVSFTWKSN